MAFGYNLVHSGFLNLESEPKSPSILAHKRYLCIEQLPRGGSRIDRDCFQDSLPSVHGHPMTQDKNIHRGIITKVIKNNEALVLRVVHCRW